MKILLVYPVGFKTLVYGQPRVPPLGICYLAAVLTKKGHRVKLIDMRLKGFGSPYLKKTLEEYQPQLVGVSATTFDYPRAQNVFRIAKEICPQATTILGGSHASLVGKKLINSTNIDLVLKGEGEKVLPKIINGLYQGKSLSSCRGLIYKNKKSQVIDKSDQREFIFNLDELPFPRFDLLPLKKYQAAELLTLPLMTSRGCPYNCIFCASWQTHGRVYRKRSPNNVVDEIEHDVKKYGAKNFSVLDDNFNFDKKRAIAICQEIIKRKLNITWQCDQGIRADKADEEVFYWMKKSGCRLVAIGIESAEPKVLQAMNKGETISVIKKTIKAAKKTGLIVKGFFIVGGPKDTENSVKKSVDFFRTMPIDIPRVSIMGAFPETKMWEWIQKNGRFIGNPHDYLSSHEQADQMNEVQFETPEFPQKKRVEMFNWAVDEAEKKTIQYKLKSIFGPQIGLLLAKIFNLKLSRQIIKKLYQMRLIKVVG